MRRQRAYDFVQTRFTQTRSLRILHAVSPRDTQEPLLDHSSQDTVSCNGNHNPVALTPATDTYQKLQDPSSPSKFKKQDSSTNDTDTTSTYQAFTSSPDKKKMSGYPPTSAPPGVYPPHNGPPQNGGGAAVPDSYFTESRKGEVNELRNLLRNFATERDPQRKRDIIKKVIAYMTLGIDVSRLFTEMMLAIETRDLVIKKMVYLFLCNYATTHPELAQMCTNTLQKDCGNDDPMVRGLALRALCSLRLPQMVEYISEPLRRSLTDHHAYVRKTGVMGIFKLYHLDQEAFERCNFVDILYDMLRDPDASVVSNCILVLNEVMDGGMAINRAIMLHLLNRIHEFSEFGVLQVLELVPRYIPANDEEGFQIMNLLDPVMRTSNSAAVMATIRAFLSLAHQVGNEAIADKSFYASRLLSLLTLHRDHPSWSIVSCKTSKHSWNSVRVSLMTSIANFTFAITNPRTSSISRWTFCPNWPIRRMRPTLWRSLAECVADANDTLSRLAVRSMAQYRLS